MCPTGERLILTGTVRVMSGRLVRRAESTCNSWELGYGHIAFNEPGSSLGSRTRVKTLAGETIRDNARFFGGEDQVPRMAVTMGVGTILDSRQCLLLALGEHKARAIRDTVEGPVTAQVTASALQLHRDVVVILDEAAASLLARREYYDQVERVRQELELAQADRAVR